jgi:hypothetical protein
MKITITHDLDTDNHGQYAGLKTEIVTNAGNGNVIFRGGEPEDFSLTRDLNDAFKIQDLLVLAYNAGKAGEDIEIEKLTIENYE